MALKSSHLPAWRFLLLWLIGLLLAATPFVYAIRWW